MKTDTALVLALTVVILFFDNFLLPFPCLSKGQTIAMLACSVGLGVIGIIEFFTSINNRKDKQ